MKKLLFISLSIFLFVSCSTKKQIVEMPKKAAEETKIEPIVENIPEKKFKGNWTLTNISYVGQEYFKITSFQLADSKCFVGSSWEFIPNNDQGSLTISGANCPKFTSPIVWSMSKEKMFSLKILKDLQARNVKVGFYFIVQNLTEDSFELSDRMDIGGKLTEVIYRFEKNQ